MKPLQLLDPIIHSPLRLAVMTLLAGVKDADFVFLRESTGATDGNLSTHLLKLEDARYIRSTKEFRDRKPNTRYMLTAAGRQAFTRYFELLEQYIRISGHDK